MSNISGFRCNRCEHFIVKEDLTAYGDPRIPKGWAQYFLFNDRLPYRHLCDSCVKELGLK